jgi:hypothetical protein
MNPEIEFGVNVGFLFRCDELYLKYLKGPRLLGNVAG